MRSLRIRGSRLQLMCLLVLALQLTALTTCVTAQDAAAAATAAEAQTYRSAGDRLLARGDSQSALRAYNQALDLDPNSFMTVHKRATTYLSMGRHQQALQDLDKLLDLKPDFHQAHLLKAKIFAKEGDFDGAEQEVKKWLKHNKNDVEGKQLEADIAAARRFIKQARGALSARNYDLCINAATEALRFGPNSADAREIRLACLEGVGDLDGILADLTRLSHLKPSSTELPVKLAHLYFFLAFDASRALQHVKQCLHYDPDSKACKAVNRLIRGFDKDMARARNFLDAQRWRECIQILLGDGKDGLLHRVQDAMDASGYFANYRAEASSTLAELHAWVCRSQVRLGNVDGMKKHCSRVLEFDGGDQYLDAWIAKGEIASKEERWDDAVRAFNDAFEKSGRSSQDILNRLQRAQKLLKQSKSKDYYKVLGVSRDADERTIKKAYRKLAKKNHPDVGGSEEKMAQLNEAYEVLNNPELKARFDNGDDPNDTSQQQGGFGGNPFAHFGGGGHPFGQFFQQGPNFQQFMFQQGGGRRAGGGGGGGGNPFEGQKMFFQFQQHG